MNEYISVQGEGEMNKCEYYDRMGCCAPEKVSTEYCSTCNHTFKGDLGHGNRNNSRYTYTASSPEETGRWLLGRRGCTS